MDRIRASRNLPEPHPRADASPRTEPRPAPAVRERDPVTENLNRNRDREAFRNSALMRDLRRRFGLVNSSRDLPRVQSRMVDRDAHGEGDATVAEPSEAPLTVDSASREPTRRGGFVVGGRRFDTSSGESGAREAGRGRIQGIDSVPGTRGRFVTPSPTPDVGDASSPPGTKGGPGEDPVIPGAVTDVDTRALPPVSDSELVTGTTVVPPLHPSSGTAGYFGYGGKLFHSPYHIHYPYYGYYSLYRYPYLRRYGCNFWSGFYVRFGHFHSSLYTLCSPFYFSRWGYRHHHRYYCVRHRYYHYYRLRDCGLCYPYSSDIIIHQTIVSESPEAEEQVQSLKPGELRFCEGWAYLRAGNYEEAAEAFYNASLEIPTSSLVQLYLGASLAGLGEYELAAASFDDAYERRSNLVGYRWDTASHFGSKESFQELIDRIEAYLEVTPGESAAWLSLGFLSLLAEEDRDDLARARRAAGEVIVFAHDSKLASAILAEAERRDLAEDPPPEPTDADVQAWLLAPSCEAIPRLSLGVN